MYEAFSTPPSFLNLEGVRKFADYTTNVVNTRNGIRITTHQPHNPKRAIFLVGCCTLYGWGADDANTPASLLQNSLNLYANERGFVVYNYSYICGPWEQGGGEMLAILRSLPLKQGDIVLVCSPAIWGIPHCNLALKFMRPHNYGELFTDRGHYSKHGNRMVADGIFEFLQKHNFFEEKLIGEWNMPESEDNDADEDEQLNDYRKSLRKIYREKLAPRVGAIVMNCNPFTLGHRYLVEQALKHCDRLIVFVVEEDKSVFPFADRLQLVKENLADLKNVLVLPSGEFIISSRTFEEYFNKESLQEHKIDTSTDVTLFASKIAPCLNISVRFAGEEPFDTVTRQYNETMARILPQYGLKFVEIPRLKKNNTPISASHVRELVKAREFNELKKFVPKKTLAYLKTYMANDDSVN